MSIAALKATKAQKLVTELCGLIKEKFPEAEFEIAEGMDTGGIHIYAYAHIDSVWDMLPLVSDRVTDILVQERLPIYVIPMRKEGHAR